MTKWNTAIGDTFISNTSLKLLTVSIPSPLSAPELFITDEIGQLPLLTFSIYLLVLEHVNIILLMRNFQSTFHAVRGPLSHTRTLEGRTHQAVSVGHCCRHERP